MTQTFAPGSFGGRLRAAVAEYGHTCVGIDPHESLLRSWELPVDADGAREFGLRVVDAAAGRVGVVKPQVAFFERYGAAGFAALEAVLDAARTAGLVTIADAKRGDIGSTMDGYAAAWLPAGAPLEADALTVSPYLGVGALASAAALALSHGKGLFVLAATSNPEALELQRAERGGDTVAARVLREVAALDDSEGEWGSLGVVIGATVDLAATGLAEGAQRPLPILAPGFGAQGADVSDLPQIFGALTPAVLASESRSLLDGGPEQLVTRLDARKRRYAESAA